MRVLRSTPATLEAVFYPAGAEAPAADAPVTVAVTRADGTTVSGVGAVSTPSAGTYRATLPAQANLDLLTATWTGATQTVVTEVEIVGGFYVPLAQIRAEPNLSDANVFTTAELEAALAWFESLAEDHCRTAFVPRFARETFDGTGTTGARLRTSHARRLLAATIDGATVSTTGWDLYPDGRVDTRDAGVTFSVGRRNVAVSYEHGLDRPPADLVRAALTAVRWRLLTDASQKIPDRAISLVNEFGNVQMAVPGTDRPSGIPEVDAVLNRFRDQISWAVA